MSKKKGDAKVLQVKKLEGESEAQALARFSIMPEVYATSTIMKAENSSFPTELLDITSLVEELNRQSALVSKGDLSRADAMLTAQTHILDQLFNKLVSLSMSSDTMGAMENYLKLSLKTQSQCRVTWETVAVLKNPPVVKQVNIGHNQLINNPPNQLENDDLQAIERSKGITVPAATPTQAVAEVYRAKDTGRKA